MDLEEFGQQFPITDRLSWLATPSCAPPADLVLNAIRSELDAWGVGEVSWNERDQRAERCRTLFADLLGIAPQRVALLSSTAEAAATVARSLPPGARIVVGAQEYRSNLFPWLAADGPVIDEVPMPDGLLDSGRVCEAIVDGTDLVAVSVVQSATGSRVDLVPIAERCREVGARLFLDATQSAGVLAIPPTVDPDYVAAHGYKWLLGVRGAAYLAVRPEHLDELEPLAANIRTTGRGATDYYGGPLSYADDAERLDVPLGWPVWAAAEAGLELLGAVEPISLQRHCLERAAELTDGARGLGLAMLPSERPSHVVTVRVRDTYRAVEALTVAGVRATARAGNLRFGFHGFTGSRDVERTLAVLSKLAV